MRVQHRRQQAEGEDHGPAAEVADQVQRDGRLFGRPHGVKRAAQRDVVDVVAGSLGIGSVLAPSVHPANHDLWIAGEHDVGPEPQPLHHSWPEALDQGVRRADQAERRFPPGVRLEVEFYGTAPAGLDGEAVVGRGVRPVDADHVRPQIRQEHAAERDRADRPEFDDPKALQRPGSPAHGRRSRRSRRTRIPAASRSQVSAVTPSARSRCFSTFSVAVFGNSAS